MSGEAPNKKNMVAIKDLPVYTKPPCIEQCSFVEDDPIPGQGAFATVRGVLGDLGIVVSNRVDVTRKSLDDQMKPVRTARDIIADTAAANDAHFFSKAAAIALGGMAGLVFSMRKGGKLRRSMYVLGGVLTMSAFCYPHETVHVVRTGIEHSRMAWDDFQQSPEPKK